ncbi:MAG: primase [Frankiales bacterium]|nr:primase [Frankiales bacterium]
MHALVRKTLLAGLTGALTVSAAWAGVGLVPVPAADEAARAVPGVVGAAPAVAGAKDPVRLPVPTGAGETQTVGKAGPLRALEPGEMYVGAARTNLLPDEKAAAAVGGRWEKDRSKCLVLDPVFAERLASNTAGEADHLASAGSPWPENPDCLYMGGYGLGPMNPITSFDPELGLWVRAIALGDGKDLTVLTVIDAEGYLWDYANKCDDCGTKAIGEALAADPELKARGMKADSLNLHATHSHTSLDLLGGWGFVPDWYMTQVTARIKETVRQAVLTMEPATLQVGKVDARRNNSERRGTYRSAEESELSWLRAVGKGDKTIATLGAFAAHPVTQDTDKGVAHADWPGYFAKAAEDRFGGIAMHMMTGLGNVTGARGRGKDADGHALQNSTGDALVALIPGSGKVVRDPDLRVASTTWRQPVTNAPLDALGTPGFFDRQFDLQPATVRVGKNPDEAPCVSAAPQSVELPARAMKIGDDVVMTTGPGELFSNLTNTIKEKSPDQVVFPFAQTNDSLGYMPQSFELNPVGQQGLGFAAGGYVFVNYEDSYAIDRCVGDMALETTLALVSGLK